MNVFIDTNGLYTTQAGIARVIRGLLKGLKAVQPADMQISELAWPVENFEYRQPQRAFKTLYRELVWSKWVAPLELSRRRADLLHSTGSALVRPASGRANVVTLHDLAVLRFPQRFRTWHRTSEMRRFRRLPKMDRIICVSRFTASEAMSLLGLPASKLEVVHNGCDFLRENDIPAEQAPEILVPSEYFLFVGSLEPGKNLALLRQTYELARQAGRPLPPLMIVGARWAGVAGEGKPPDDWHYLGRQPDSVLVYLYRRALALVFPSKYEGFGLPVVEAMALGCPVICSPVASMPEVGGEAALYAEQTPQAYLEAMSCVAREEDLRRGMVEKGRKHAGQFTWTGCAAQTAEVYRTVLRR